MNFCGPYDKQIAEQYRPSLPTPLLAGWEFWQKSTPSADKAGWMAVAKAQDWVLTKRVRDELRSTIWAVVITDIHQCIQYVNAQFEQMTGYSRQEAVGHQPNFLQGDATSTLARQRLKQAVERQKSVNECVLNYRKDQTPYWCQIQIFPLMNSQKQVVNFIAFEQEIPENERNV